MASATVFSPGPGVVMTLTNSIRYGINGTIGGILGISLGALIVAGISATGLGLLLATSASAFTVMKLIGAAYLIYLGIKLWNAREFELKEKDANEVNFGKRLIEGVTLQLTNPKAIFFFLSIFPQFIDASIGYIGQFSVLVLM